MLCSFSGFGNFPLLNTFGTLISIFASYSFKALKILNDMFSISDLRYDKLALCLLGILLENLIECDYMPIVILEVKINSNRHILYLFSHNCC